MESQTLIPLNELIKDYQSKDIVVFANYLMEIWKDLARRAEPSKGMDFLRFSAYYDIPLLINQRLFNAFDKDKNNFLSAKEFIEGMMIIFSGQFTTLIKFIFRLYDFDGDDKITKEDVRIVLSHIPLGENNNFDDRVQAQEELFGIIDKTFGISPFLDLQNFTFIIENVKSDIFIYFLMFLLENRPFTQESLQIIKKDKDPINKVLISMTPPIEFRRIISPSLNSKFFVSPSLKKRTLFFLNDKKNLFDFYFTKAREQSSIKKKKEEKYQNTKENTMNNMNKLKKIKKTFNEIEDYSKFNTNLTVISENNSVATTLKGLNLTKDMQKINGEVVTQEGYLYKITPYQTMKKVYFKLVGRDLFYYNAKDSISHKGLHHLSGVYIRKCESLKHNNKNYFSFSLIFPDKTRFYYTESNYECTTWINSLYKVLHYKNVFDNYEINEKIGKGKFGIVKIATHKKTKQQYAIKIISKNAMTVQDLELALTEINILKLCQHPNIIKLYDVYDSPDFIYIIMEYCKGGDLFTYIESRHFKLEEKKVAEIIHKLSMAIYYIHSFGIVHRDLKPENTLMTDNTDKADIRLLDFGLSKIIGPHEKMREPFGTLSYVAPEVLEERPYDKSADMWSMGVITYLLLCGYLPFDDPISEREIARKTIQEEPKFPINIFGKISTEAKEFIERLLRKNPKDRLTIEEVLTHNWFKKFNLIHTERINFKDNDKQSKFYIFTTNVIHKI